MKVTSDEANNIDKGPPLIVKLHDAHHLCSYDF